MLLGDFIKTAPTLYKTRATRLLEGPPGCGKTSAVHRIAEILSKIYDTPFGVWTELISQRDASDVGGLCFPIKGADGHPAATYTRPAMAPSQKYLEEHPCGIYFLDEYGQGGDDIKKAVSTILLERRIGSVQLPEGWWVLAASNRMQDGAGVKRNLSMNVNRVNIVQIENDIKSWTAWATVAGIHPLYMTAAQKNPSAFFASEVPKHGGPFCTARSLVAAARDHAEAAGRDQHGRVSMELPWDGPITEIIEGHIGSAAAAELLAYIKLHEYMPEFDDVVKDPMHAMVPGPERLDAAFAIGQMLVAYIEQDNVKQVWQYAERLPKDLQVTIMTGLMNKMGSLVLNSPELSRWMINNKALFKATFG